jgi:ABC-type nitrate/sulfonate/bicarbonate transport system substrate-binding protein
VKSRLVCAVALAALLAVPALACGGCARREVPPELERLRLGTYEGELSALVFLAESEGFFAGQGLEVELLEYSSGGPAADALLAGDVDVATCSEFVTVRNGFGHPELRVLAGLAAGESNVLLVRPDRGISETGDLEGRRIAMVPGTSSEYCLCTYLVSAGIPSSRVELAGLDPVALAEAFCSGEVDAAVIWEPNAYAVRERMGERAAAWSAQAGNDLYWLLLGTDRLWRSGPTR